MLIRRLIIEFSIVCDNCGAVAGYERESDDARWQARETGFVYYEYLRNGKPCHSDYCSECNHKLPESERQRMGRAQPAPMFKPEPGVWL